MKLTLEQQISRRLYSLETIRNPFVATWKELADEILNYRGVFDSTSKRRVRKINTNTKNNTAEIAAINLAAGLMGGVSSPSKPWVNFVVANLELMESTEVRIWLEKVEKITYTVLSKSNIYNSIHTFYRELVVFGTGAMGVFEDFDDVIHTECYTVGTYYLDVNYKGRIDTFYRRLTMTAEDIIRKFGEKALPDIFIDNDNRSKNSIEYEIVHAIEPNRNFKPDSQVAKYKAFSSIYIYHGKSTSTDDQQNVQRELKVISETGYDEFPIMVARWDVIPGDVYGGSCPGMTAIGDVKELQYLTGLVSRGMEKMVDPPTVSGPTRGAIPEEGLEPGQHIEVDNVQEATMTSVYDVNFEVSGPSMMGEKIEDRIKVAFYEHLFQQMLSSDRREMTASEVNVRSNEALMQLGPILTRLHHELLDPLTDRVFNIIARAEMLPEAPDSLEGYELSVEYISTLAKAQKADVSQTIERFLAFIGGIAQIDPSAINKLNTNSLVNEFSNAMGVPPKVVNSDDVANTLTQQQQAQAAEQQQQSLMLEAAKVAPDVISAAQEAGQQPQE